MYKKYKIFCLSLFLTLCLLCFSCSIFIQCANFILLPKLPREHIQTHYWFEQKEKIAKDNFSGQNKIVFVGGSSTLFGINTKEIENAINIPVLNFGIHASYRRVILEKVKNILVPKDIVIIPLEYSGYQNEQFVFNDFELAYLFLYEKRLYKTMDLKNRINCIRYFIKHILEIRKPKALLKYEKKYPAINNTAYSIKYWNEHGDIEYFVRETEKEKMQKIISKLAYDKEKLFTQNDFKNVSDKNFYINKFLKWADENEIQVYFIAPTTIAEGKNFNKAHYNIKELWTQGGYKYLDNVDESFYPETLFYDTKSHLTTEGAKLRTKQIIKLLKENSQIYHKFF